MENIEKSLGKEELRRLDPVLLLIVTVINLRSFLIMFLISELFDKMMNLQVIAAEDFRC